MNHKGFVSSWVSAYNFSLFWDPFRYKVLCKWAQACTIYNEALSFWQTLVHMRIMRSYCSSFESELNLPGARLWSIFCILSSSSLLPEVYIYDKNESSYSCRPNILSIHFLQHLSLPHFPKKKNINLEQQSSGSSISYGFKDSFVLLINWLAKF